MVPGEDDFVWIYGGLTSAAQERYRAVRL